MIVGIIGSGGREHALCESLKRSNKINKIYCFPGNAGTDSIAENINVNLNDFENLKNIILERNIDIIIVGPEKPLVDGLVDYLEKYKPADKEELEKLIQSLWDVLKKINQIFPSEELEGSSTAYSLEDYGSID